MLAQQAHASHSGIGNLSGGRPCPKGICDRTGSGKAECLPHLAVVGLILALLFKRERRQWTNQKSGEPFEGERSWHCRNEGDRGATCGVEDHGGTSEPHELNANAMTAWWDLDRDSSL